jgi:hypothetical protein
MAPAGRVGAAVTARLSLRPERLVPLDMRLRPRSSRRSPGGVLDTHLNVPRSAAFLPSARLTASAFPPKNWRLSIAKQLFRRPRLYKFRGSITRPAPSFPLASDTCYQVCPQGSLPTCWLGFSRVGFSPTG